MIAEASALRIALTTVGSVDEGRRLGRLLVERKLAACVNLVPVLASIYRWKDAVEEQHEILLLIKTTAESLPDLEAALRELHAYELPEFLALNIESASRLYLDWVLDSTGASSRS